MSSKRRAGRPLGEHRLPGGDKVIGLSRDAEGRWRISATGERFRASEAEALRRRVRRARLVRVV